MARGRLISRTLGSSRKFAALRSSAGELGEFAQLLYPMLIACSDDFGRMAGDAFTVKLTVFPSSPRSQDEFYAALTALHQARLIHRYLADNGDEILSIVDFDEYQPGLSRRTDSKFPAPPVNFTAIHGNSREPREFHSEEKGIEEKRTEGKGTEGADAPALRAVGGTDIEAPDCKIDALVLKWNQTVTAPIPQCKGLSSSRKSHARARLKQNLLDDLMRGIDKIQASEFMHGANDRGWKPDFGWYVQSQDNVIKVLEGKYDNRGPRAVETYTGPVIDDAEETRRKQRAMRESA